MTLEELENTKEGIRFFKKVNKTSYCWLWIAGRTGGYGHVYCSKLKKPLKSHVWIMRQLYGPPDKGREVCHKCNIKLCCNPSHLYYGTRSDNAKDQVATGIHNFLNNGKKGILSPLAKIDDAIVREIRRLRDLGLTYRAIAEKLALNISTVGNVINKNRWKHVV